MNPISIRLLNQQLIAPQFSKPDEEALSAKGITMDDHRLSYHIRYAELDGVICSGDLLPMKTTYALSERKIPRTEPIERDWALARLATKYFQSHSPATLEDFVWWSGLNVGDCKRAIDSIGNHLYCDPYKGNTPESMSYFRGHIVHKRVVIYLTV